jgi:phosphatidylglycerol:prolipoprotein diacylglycerol transferase
LTYYGGFLLVVPTGIWFLRRYDLPAWKVADLAGFCIPLGIGFGRLGCFFAGCCFGDVCDFPWAVSFPAGSPAAGVHLDAQWIGAGDPSLPVHPAQLYSVLFNWGIAAFMYWWYRHKRAFDGEVFWLFAILYALFRFLVEILRADERGGYFGASTSQIIGVLLVGLSLYMLSRLYRKALASKSLSG